MFVLVFSSQTWTYPEPSVDQWLALCLTHEKDALPRSAAGELPMRWRGRSSQGDSSGRSGPWPGSRVPVFRFSSNESSNKHVAVAQKMVPKFGTLVNGTKN